MSETISTKKYPAATPQAGSLLGLDKAHGLLEADAGHLSHATSAGPHNLPIIDASAQKIEHGAHNAGGHETLQEAAAHQPAWKKTLTMVGPYFAVFAVGLVLYYFFLGKTDLTAVLDKIKPAPTAVQSPKESALESLEKQNLGAYQAWIAQYYFDVSDSSITDPNADNSGNGLSNFQKYLLNLNPRAYDTLGLGMADSQALSQGLNPLTGGALTDAQKGVIDKYFDMEAIMNRLALNQLNNSKNVAGASTYYGNQAQSVVPNQNNQNSQIAPATGADLSAANLDIDQSRPGLLEIPSLKISAPLIWTQDPKNFDTDLRSGVVHYPGTALPGQIGTAYISGHSSNYVWAKGNYNRVFSKLGDLADNASFTITVYLKDGSKVVEHYVVTRRGEYSATDQSQFKNASVPTVALSTCWPVNTTQKRLVVFGELTQVEK